MRIWLRFMFIRNKARKVYESWGGKLSDHEQDYMIMGRGYPEVFYVYEI